jgi:oxygen-independent coproporphyrinogen III oxidase
MTPLSPAELAAWDRPGPRYTSYPPVPFWEADPDPRLARGALARLRSPAQVYVHVPFCRWQCNYCGCNMVVARRDDAAEGYLRRMEAVVAGLPLPAPKVPVQRVHLGGGTPTWLSPAALVRLVGSVLSRFSPVPGAELSVEAHPSVTTLDHLDALAALGFRRLSLGVQSLDPAVLAAVDRPSSEAEVDALVHAARARRMDVGLDLMIGLPAQTVAAVDATLDRVLDWRPQRLAVFGYAHVPWARRHQGRIDAALLPGPVERAAQALRAAARLEAAGYVPVGFDHYALPDDALGRAALHGGLHRNFMGATTLPEVDLVGVGPSAISEVAGTYWQDEPHLGRWQRKVDLGAPLQSRGTTLSAEQRRTRFVVNAVLSELRVDGAALWRDQGWSAADWLDPARPALAPLVDAGLVQLGADWLSVTPRGRPLARLAAYALDPALRGRQGDAGRYSSTV